MAQQFAVMETAMPVLREGGVIGNAVVQIEAAKPAVREAQMGLFTVPPHRPDAETVANQQHADQQFRIDRQAPDVAVEIRAVRPNAAQIDKAINQPQKSTALFVTLALISRMH